MYTHVVFVILEKMTPVCVIEHRHCQIAQLEYTGRIIVQTTVTYISKVRHQIDNEAAYLVLSPQVQVLIGMLTICHPPPEPTRDRFPSADSSLLAGELQFY